MVNFKKLEEEIRKYKEGFVYSNDAEGGKSYVIHSLPLKQSLRGLLSCWDGACEVKYDAERDTMEHKLEKNGKFGIYREMNDLPDELVILDSQPKVSKDSESGIKIVEIEDKFFTLPKVERVTPVTPVEPVKPVEKVTPVTPVGSDENYEGYHTVLSFQKDVKTGQKIFTKISQRGNDNERERIMIEGGNFSQREEPQNSRFMEIDENEAKQEQLPPHNFYKKK
jgi:hypothetical protein